MIIDETELKVRFSYHPPTGAEQALFYRDMREGAKRLADFIVDHTPHSREQALAITALEECVMWANAAMARRS